MKISIFFAFFATVAGLTLVSAKSSKYAILVATTNTWTYYRHQSNVMKAYHTLIANGFKKDNIITMYYDDITNNPRNNETGIVRNHPNGLNLVPGMKKDYTGNKVNAETLLAILEGDHSKAGGPVLKSGPKDSVFVFITGLGTHGALYFPTGSILTANKLATALKNIRSAKRAAKIFLSLDVSYATSMAHDLYPSDGKIFVSAATHHSELPYAVFCYRSRKICYGSLYGSAWMMHSDRLRQMKYGRRETLFDQYNYVRTLCVYSHVSMFGDLNMGKTKLKKFLDYKLERKSNDISLMTRLGEDALEELEDQMDDDPDNAELEEKYEMLSKMYDAVDESSFNIAEEGNSAPLDVAEMLHEHDIAIAFADAEHEKTEIHKKRAVIENVMDAIVKELNINSGNELPKNALTDSAYENYEKAISAFSSHCIDVASNPHALHHLGKLARINELGIPLEEQISAMKQACTDFHRAMKSTH